MPWRLSVEEKKYWQDAVDIKRKNVGPYDLSKFFTDTLRERLQPEGTVGDDLPRNTHGIYNRVQDMMCLSRGKNDPFMPEMSLADNAHDPRGWSLAPPMEQIKVQSYARANNTERNLYPASQPQFTFDAPMTNTKLSETYKQLQQDAKTRYTNFDTEQLGYAPSYSGAMKQDTGQLPFMVQPQQKFMEIANMSLAAKQTLRPLGQYNPP